MIVVAGPSTDLLPTEADLLRAYLEEGGKLLLMLDPPDTEEDPPQPNLIALANEWGIEVGSDVVVDASGVGQLLGTDASVPVASSYPPHAITDGFNLLTAFPLARSVRPMAGGAAAGSPRWSSRPAPGAGRRPTWASSRPGRSPWTRTPATCPGRYRSARSCRRR